MIIIPYYQSGARAGLGAKHYAWNIWTPPCGQAPTYSEWLAQQGGILMHNNLPTSEWKIMFVNDCDLVAFKLKFES